MEQRLIDADAVVENLMDSYWFDCDDIDVALQAVKLTDTIDPKSLQPTAHWVKDGSVENPYTGSGTKYHCSACGRRAGYKQRWFYKYCPNCGAKMEADHG